jgi:hypothetical protein
VKEESTSQSGLSNLRVLVGLVGSSAGVFLALLTFGAFSNAFAQANGTKPSLNGTQGQAPKAGAQVIGQSFWVSTNGPQGLRLAI